MPQTVQDVMNRELLVVRPDLPAGEVRELLRSFQIAAAPVVDEVYRPLGVVSLSDPLEIGGTARERMSRPALCITTSATIAQAARQLAEMDTHHLVVVDGSGTAVGMLSVVDVLRALLDLPTRHPRTFPHWDQAAAVSWTDDWPVDERAAQHAPSAPGILVLATSRLGEIEKVLWVEPCHDLRARVSSLIAGGIPDEPLLTRALATPNLRFRAAVAVDDGVRSRVVALLKDRVAHVPPPGGT
jgi:CBS domain-containing protein